jgi:hypothetical protein
MFATAAKAVGGEKLDQKVKKFAANVWQDLALHNFRSIVIVCLRVGQE